MKILHLYGADQDQGGIFSVLRNLAAASAPLGWRHVVWVNERFQELRTSTLEYRRSRHLLDESASHIRLLWGALRAQRELFGLLEAERFDVVHAHSRGGLAALLLARRRGRHPMVFTNHTYARRRWLYRWVARRPGMFTTLLTGAMADYYGLSPDGDQIRVISSCCSDAFFAEPLHRPRPPSPAQGPVRLTGLGSLVRWKNWQLIPAALALLTTEQRQRFQVQIFGPTLHTKASSAFERELRAAIEQQGLAGQFQLAGPSADAAAELRRADWLIHPAINEPCGLAVIEALALGVPVLAARSGGPAELVRPGETGLLFSPNTPAALADRLRELLAAPPRLLPPEAIRESVRARSASGVLPRYAELYGRLCGQLEGSAA
jgi:glycosyltransferase involved in cell wall biosynthesis